MSTIEVDQIEFEGLIMALCYVGGMAIVGGFIVWHFSNQSDDKR